MLPPTDESDKVPTHGTHRAGTTMTIAQWWNKFHFSGRVIMCSVLFGLGLILVGGLVFAINMDDVSSNNSNNEDSSEQMPTKAPSKYVGPVLMGIGCFIVIVGVIMCLFETHVFRKRTGDARPLIIEKADQEGKGSEIIPVPGPSHSHKSHKHGTRKIGVSPKKSKSRHTKSHTKEKGKKSSPTPRSPPVSIEQEKGFITSSEERFLTPPNVPDEDIASNMKKHQITDNSGSSALMKSFTSSGPSWSQSTEFMTPSTSFRDSSVSLDNSVEVDEKQQLANYKTDMEYMTPLTVEEDRIQRLLIRVQNEQREKAKREMELKMSENDLSATKENGSKMSLDIPTEMDKEDIRSTDEMENKYVASDVSPLPDLNDISQRQMAETKDIEQFESKKTNEEKQSASHSDNNDGEKDFDGNETEKKKSLLADDINRNENASLEEAEKLKASRINESTSFLGENKAVSDLYFNAESSDDKINSSDLENSNSSVETVVSPDTFNRKSKIIDENEKSTSIENSNNQCKINASESLGDAADSKSDDHNVSSGVTKDEDDLPDSSNGESHNVDEHSAATPADDFS